MSYLNFNKFFLGGRISKKPELISSNGIVYVSFRVTVDRYEDGMKHTSTFNCVAHGKSKAEFIYRNFTVGSAIFITGHIESNGYINKRQELVEYFTVYVDDVSFVDPKPKNFDPDAEPG